MEIIQTDSKLKPQIYYNSGKQFNDLGNIQACENNDNLTYYTQVIGLSDSVYFFWGLCMPKLCTVNSLKEYNPSMLILIN